MPPMAIQTDHVLRGLEAAARRIARTLSVSERDVPPSRALRRALDRDAGDLPEVATELGRKLSDAPHRRKLGLAAHRLAATRTRHPRGLRRAGGVPHGPRDGATLARGRRRAPAGVGRAATPAVAGGDVRVPSGRRWRCAQHSAVLATAARGACAEAGARTAARRRQTREVLGDVPGDRGHPGAAGHPGVRARGGELHEVGGTTWPGCWSSRASRCPRGLPTSCPCRCSSRATNWRTPPRSWTSGSRCRRPERLLRRRGNELEVMVGYSDSAKEVGMLAANLELYARAAIDGGVGARARAAAHDLPRPGRRLGPRRRTGEPGDRRGATGFGARPVQGDRAGRGGVRPLREPRAGAPAPGATHERRGAREPRNRPSAHDPADGFTEEIAALSAASRERYEALVHADGFVEFFRRVTPIAQIGTLPIASRPVSRGLAAGAVTRGPARDPVGLRLGSEPREPHRVVRARRRTRGGGGTPRRARAPPRDGARVAVLRHAARERRALAREGGPRRSPSSTSRAATAPTSAPRSARRCERTTELVLAVTGHDRAAGRQARAAARDRVPQPLRRCPVVPPGAVPGRTPGVRTERLIQATISGVAAGLQNTG